MLQLIGNLFFFSLAVLSYVPRYVGAFQAIKEYDNNNQVHQISIEIRREAFTNIL